jgi:hypothetical protein
MAAAASMAVAAAVAAAMTATTATAAVEGHRAALTCEHKFHAGCVRECESTFSLRHVCLFPVCGVAAPDELHLQLNAAIHESGRQLTFLHARCLFGQTNSWSIICRTEASF